MKRHTDTELNSLIRLLADDDETTLSMVTARLLELGDHAVPALWDARMTAPGSTRRRIDGILGRLSPEAGTELAWETWQALAEQEGDVDLERGVAAIARVPYPALDWDPYRRMLDRMADQLSFRLIGVNEPVDIIRSLSRYLFQDQGFMGREAGYRDPDDHFLNRVLDRRRGIPIAISAVCLLVTQRLRLPIYGVNFPLHFITKYQTEHAEVLFDPFHKGTIITREACEAFAISLRRPFSEEFLTPATHRVILCRMLNNLTEVYGHREERAMVKRLRQYIRSMARDRV